MNPELCDKGIKLSKKINVLCVEEHIVRIHCMAFLATKSRRRKNKRYEKFELKTSKGRCSLEAVGTINYLLPEIWLLRMTSSIHQYRETNDVKEKR